MDRITIASQAAQSRRNRSRPTTSTPTPTRPKKQLIPAERNTDVGLSHDGEVQPTPDTSASRVTALNAASRPVRSVPRHTRQQGLAHEAVASAPIEQSRPADQVAPAIAGARTVRIPMDQTRRPVRRRTAERTA